MVPLLLLRLSQLRSCFSVHVCACVPCRCHSKSRNSSNSSSNRNSVEQQQQQQEQQQEQQGATTATTTMASSETLLFLTLKSALKYQLPSSLINKSVFIGLYWCLRSSCLGFEIVAVACVVLSRVMWAYKKVSRLSLRLADESKTFKPDN